MISLIIQRILPLITAFVRPPSFMLFAAKRLEIKEQKVIYVHHMELHLKNTERHTREVLQMRCY